MESFKVFIEAAESQPSKAEILRGLVTEKMTVAVRKILAAVGTTVDEQENEVLLLKEELGRRRKQLDAILQPQINHYETTGDFVVSSESRQSEVKILRAMVTEIISEAVQEIFAVVKMTIAAHNLEVSSLKEELDRHETKLRSILQPKVNLYKIDASRYEKDDKKSDSKLCGATETRNLTSGVDGVATKRSPGKTSLLVHEESDCALTDLPNDSSVSSPVHKEQPHSDDKINYVHKKDVGSKRIKRLPKRYRLNIDDCDNKWKPKENIKYLPSNMKRKPLMKIAIGLLQNIPGVELVNNAFKLEGPVRTIMCPRRQNESAFFSQLRATLPELGENKPFEAFLTDNNKRSPKLTTRLTQDKLYQAFRSCRKRQFAFCIQLKDDNETCELTTLTSLSHNNKSNTSNHTEEPPSETTGTNNPVDELDNMCVVDSASQSEGDDDDWSEDWKPEKNKEEKEHSDVPKSQKSINIRKTQPSSEKCANIGVNCKVCGVLFRTKAVLTKHALSHLDKPKLICGVCGQQVESSEELRSHLQTHQKLFYCETCGCIFLSSYSFKNHTDAHKTDTPFKCRVCGKVFSDNKFLREHELCHNYDKIYNCDTCHQSFKFKVHLEAHNRKHTGEKLYSCDICGKSLTHFRSLSRHKLIHTAEKNFSCKHCGKLFYTPVDQKQHEKIHTVRERKYLCEICSKAFHSESILRLHQKTHNGTHIVKCSICNKLLKRNLEVHMRIHTRVKPYSCSECDGKFRTQSHLKAHMRIHLGIKPFSCTVCKYTCGRKVHLDAHMRTHSGHKPYKCTQCDKAFTQSHCLKTHMKCHLTEEQSAINALN